MTYVCVNYVVNTFRMTCYCTGNWCMHACYFRAVRTASIKANGAAAVKCYGHRSCPNSQLTWCFNLYHPTKSIEVCLDSSSQLVNMTEEAAVLDLDKHFTVSLSEVRKVIIVLHPNTCC